MSGVCERELNFREQSVLLKMSQVCKLVVLGISKQIDFFQQVLGHGWVYLATEGIISLANLTES
jgi:hypothetical protein